MRHATLLCPALMLLLAAGCTHDIPMVNLGIDDTYIIPRMSKLPLHPALTGERYEWRIGGEMVSV
ncbi:MAG: hypothetical protein K2H87_07735, partial [Duncaniella sp.]|nr:hypothetical protein [Duncaniella sp.]